MRIKLLLAAAFALLLTACASGPMQVSPASVALLAGAATNRPSMGMFGSLATNPCEIATAAGYTKAFVAGRKMEQRLLQHRRAWQALQAADEVSRPAAEDAFRKTSSPAQVQPAIDAAQDALRMLDGACIDKNAVDPLALALATKRLMDLDKLLENLDASK